MEKLTKEEFKQIRLELGETQQQLADNLGLSKWGGATIRKIELGLARSSKQLDFSLIFYALGKRNGNLGLLRKILKKEKNEN